jgi:tRNA/tmRNA/rRNA uracil-C5-methylase (TrmA/RlmC/RlmD family)
VTDQIAESTSGSSVPGVPVEGALVTLDVGPVAHGGHCVARHEGRVIFVRHTLPGERVVARLTAARPTDRFWRADAVQILEPSPDRVAARCAVSGAGGCGGCDWQHVSLAGQRALKTAVLVEQLRRLAGMEIPGLAVEPVPGDDDGLGWRTRVRFAVDGAGRPGLRRHRSHDIVPVDHCPIAHPKVDEVAVGRAVWTGTAAVEVVTPATGDERLVLVEPVEEASGRADVPPLGAAASVARLRNGEVERLRGRGWVAETVQGPAGERRFRVTGSGFWQVHPGAAQTLLDVVLDYAGARAGERALDLYCGVGLFSAGLAQVVGPEGLVLGVESDPGAVRDARRSLHDLPQVRLERGRVDRVLHRLTGPGSEWETADVVVLDPPRSGAGRAVMAAVAALSPRVVVLVACDPAALARDVALAGEAGYALTDLRAFDAFPMTHHVESVARLARPAPTPVVS